MNHIDVNFNNLVVITDNGSVNKNELEFNKLEQWMASNHSFIMNAQPTTEAVKDFKDLEDFCKRIVKTLKEQENPILLAIRMLEEHSLFARDKRLVFEKEIDNIKKQAKAKIEEDFFNEVEGLDIPIEISAVFGKSEISKIIESFKKGATEKNLKNKLNEALEEIKNQSVLVLQKYQFIKEVLTHNGLEEYLAFCFTKDRYTLSIDEIKGFAQKLHQVKEQKEKEAQIQADMDAFIEAEMEAKIQEDIKPESKDPDVAQKSHIQDCFEEKRNYKAIIEFLDVPENMKMKLNEQLHIALNGTGFDFKMKWGEI